MKGFECGSSGPQCSGLGVTNLEGDRSIAFPLDLLGKQDQGFKYRFADEYSLLKKIGEFGVVAFRLDEDPEERTYQRLAIIPSDLGMIQPVCGMNLVKPSMRRATKAILPWPMVTSPNGTSG